MPSLPRGLTVPTIVAAVVTLLGALLVLLGVAKATVWAPSPTIGSSTSTVGDLPAVLVKPQELEPDATQVRMEVTAAAGRPVFIGVGRVRDVEAYLGQVARYDVTGNGDGELATVRRGGEATMPDPAGVDVWAARSRGVAKAELVWLKAPGQWAAVAATDGTSQGPATVTFTWTTGETGSGSFTFGAIGVLLLVVGGVALLVLISRSRQDGPGSFPPDPDYDPDATAISPRISPDRKISPDREMSPGAASPFASPYAPSAPPPPWQPTGKTDDDEKGTDRT